MFYPLGENAEKPMGGGIHPLLSPLVRPRVKVEYLIHRNKYLFNAQKKTHKVNTKKYYTQENVIPEEKEKSTTSKANEPTPALATCKRFFPNGKLGRFLRLEQLCFLCKIWPTNLSYLLDYTSVTLSVSYTFSFFWRKYPGRFVTYLTFPAMNNNDFVVFTNYPLGVVWF